MGGLMARKRMERRPSRGSMARRSMMRFVWAILVAQALLVSACATARPASVPPLGPVETRGRATFKAYCARCHATTGDTVVVGPSLAGIATLGATRVEGMDAEAYIRESILDPTAYMVEGFPEGLMPLELVVDLEPDDLDDLVTYLMTLR